jgi:hypothetical protein
MMNNNVQTIEWWWKLDTTLDSAQLIGNIILESFSKIGHSTCILWVPIALIYNILFWGQLFRKIQLNVYFDAEIT